MRTVNYPFGTVVIPTFTRCQKQEPGSLAGKQSIPKAVDAGLPRHMSTWLKKSVSTPFEFLAPGIYGANSNTAKLQHEVKRNQVFDLS